jgi:RimJ/RimL family protein N-acetyltransferase
MTQIETARLLLRPWQPDDLVEFTRLLTDPVVTRYIVVHTPFSPPGRSRAVGAHPCPVGAQRLRAVGGDREADRPLGRPDRLE